MKALKQTINAFVANIVKMLRDTKDSIKQMFVEIKSHLLLTKSYYPGLIKLNLQIIKTQTVSRFVTLRLILIGHIKALKCDLAMRGQALKQTIRGNIAHLVKIQRDTKEDTKQLFGKLRAQVQKTKLYYSELLKSKVKELKKSLSHMKLYVNNIRETLYRN